MASHYHHALFLDGPAGRMEALFWTVAESDPPMAALVCHPHPLFGGTMHNKVVFRVARTLNELGLPVLRFNFRGTGLSEGVHDEGRGELDDVRAALDWLAAKFPAKPILLAGFSFGALVGLRAGCADERVSGVVGLGFPLNRADGGFLRACPKPKLFLHGSEDQFGNVDKLRELVASLPETKRLVVVPGVDHFFTGKLDEVDRGLREWMTAWQPGLRAHASSTE
ncbi:MAG TPA: alpha/beta fold hydrolase [Patescibacteria group bacterium]|nr:alpha/beta fold hydrolase [Patescibacteria group bacterium]